MNQEKSNNRKEKTKPITPLEDYLNYYNKLKYPGYAVLVTGSWGIGKTFQVKQLIKEDERYYISLYGIDNIEGIHGAVIASSVPKIISKQLFSTWFNPFLNVLGGVLSYFKIGNISGIIGSSSQLVNAILRKRLSTERTIVFDDLERCPIIKKEKEAVLGAINFYVEHEGFRVIVICNEEQLEKFDLLKEKTFGHTIEVTANLDAAFNSFVQNLNNSDKEFILSKQSIIKDIWKQSQKKSLRILKHVILDIVRLKNTLESKYIKNQEAINHIIRFFSVLDIEIRDGKINESLLRNRQQNYYKEILSKENNEQSLLSIAQRYTNFNIADTIFDDELIISALIKGKFDKDAFSLCLDNSVYFRQGSSNMPPWKIIMQLNFRDDREVDNAVKIMQEQFNNRSITNMREFLHIAALRLMLVEIKKSTLTYKEETIIIKEYVDDLLKDGRLPIKLPTDIYDVTDSYGGYQYWYCDSSIPANYEAKNCFQEIVNYIKAKQEEVTLSSFSSERILDMLHKNPLECCSIISNYDIPFLEKINPQSFVNAWLNNNQDIRQEIVKSLLNRYSANKLNNELKEEQKWIENILNIFDITIKNTDGYEKMRLTFLKNQINLRLNRLGIN